MSQPFPSLLPSSSPVLDPPAGPLPEDPATTATATATSTASAVPVQPLPTDLTFDGAFARANDPAPRLAVVNATESQTSAVFARLFPFLTEPKSSLPIHGVCQVISSTGELVSACPLPSANVWRQYTTCLTNNCRVAGANGGALEANEACAIAQQDQCVWIAATSSLCVPLSLQPFREAQVYLPRLPFSTPASQGNLRRLLAAHHASVGIVNSPLMTDFRVTNSSSFLDPATELGVCLPTLPVGTKCDPKSDPTAVPSSFTLPWLVPLPRLEGYSFPSSALTSVIGQPQFQKSVALYSPDRPLLNLTRHAIVANMLTGLVMQPPVVLLNVPTTETNVTTPSPSTTLPSNLRNLFDSGNIYSLVYCDSASQEYRAKHLPNSSSRPCSWDLDCLFSAACNPTTRRCGAINSSSARRSMQYLGNDQFTDDRPPATRDLSSLTIQLIFLGVFLLLVLVRQFRKRIFACWARVNHKFKGASTTAQRELTLQPASNYMLDDLNDGRRRRRASMQGQQEVDAELGVLTVGDSLPRYHRGTTAATLVRGTVPRSDTADTLTLPPPFSTMDRFASAGPRAAEGLAGSAEEAGTTTVQVDVVDEQEPTQHEATEQAVAVESSRGASTLLDSPATAPLEAEVQQHAHEGRSPGHG